MSKPKSYSNISKYIISNDNNDLNPSYDPFPEDGDESDIDLEYDEDNQIEKEAFESEGIGKQ